MECRYFAVRGKRVLSNDFCGFNIELLPPSAIMLLDDAVNKEVSDPAVVNPSGAKYCVFVTIDDEVGEFEFLVFSAHGTPPLNFIVVLGAVNWVSPLEEGFTTPNNNKTSNGSPATVGPD